MKRRYLQFGFGICALGLVLAGGYFAFQPDDSPDLVIESPVGGLCQGAFHAGQESVIQVVILNRSAHSIPVVGYFDC